MADGGVADDGSAVRSRPRGHRRRCRGGRRRRPTRLRRRAVAPDVIRRAGRGPRPVRGCVRAAGRRGGRPPDRRDGRGAEVPGARHPRRRPVPLPAAGRWAGDPLPGSARRGDRQGRRAARTHRRRGRDRPLERPGDGGHHEDLPGAAHGLPDPAEARPRIAPVRLPAGRGVRGGRARDRAVQRPPRRRGGGAGAGVAPRCRHGHLHRQHRGRPPDRRHLRRPGGAGRPGARGQVRRRRP